MKTKLLRKLRSRIISIVYLGPEDSEFKVTYIDKNDEVDWEYFECNKYYILELICNIFGKSFRDSVAEQHLNTIRKRNRLKLSKKKGIKYIFKK